MKRLLVFIGFFFYALSIAFSVYVFKGIFSTQHHLNYQGLLSITLVFLSLIALGFASVFYGLNNPYRKKQLKHASLVMVFLFNCTLLLDLLILGMHRQMEWMTFESLRNAIKYSFNIIPFKTIVFYIQRYFEGSIGFSIVFNNLVGNIAIFVPSGMLMPMLFDRTRRFRTFFMCIAGMVLCVEVFQLLSNSGTFDVDDILLNVSGAVIGWYMFYASQRVLKISLRGKV